jgi:hypothetical protein
MADLTSFLRRMDAAKIAYRLDRVRDATIDIASIPGERWEIEFMDDGGVEVERFRRDGQIADESALEHLFGPDAPIS